MYRCVVKLQDVLDLQGHVFIVLSFPCLYIGKAMGQGNIYTYYKCCFVLPVDEHYTRSVNIYLLSLLCLSPLCRAFTVIYLEQIMFLVCIVLQVFCLYNLCYM